MGNIRLDSRTTTSAIVVWNAPTLDESHKTRTGEQLTIVEVSYKVYKVAKNGELERRVDQIKTADSSPQTVGAGITRWELTGLTEDTSYELVVQAVNSIDETKESEGARYEFKILESFAAPGTPSIEAEANRNAIDISIRAPENKGTVEDGTTKLRDDQISYIVYYYASEGAIDAAEVKASAGTEKNANVGGKQELATGTTIHRITGLDYEKTYYITVEAVNSLEINKKSSPTTVVSVETSLATVPAEVSNIQVTSKATIATVTWDAPTLDESHKTKTGEQLTTVEVSYKVYIVEKNEDSERTVDQIKAADSSPQTVGAEITRLELIGLTKNTSYELVVQAINSTDETKASIGIREEFRTNESFVIRDIKGWKKHETPPWSERSSNTVNFKNRIWIIGGSNKRNYFNEVWSSADGKRWKKHITYVKGDSTKKKPIWSARYRMATIVFKNKIWIMGGVGNNYYNDVWSSADGEVWEKHTTRNEDTSKTDIWSRRTINAFVKFNDRIWIFGGQEGESFYEDVWSSADGETWKKHSTRIGDTKITTFWNLPDSAIVFNDEIWLIDYNTGIWKSGDGEVWTTFGNKDIILASATLLQWDSKLWILGGWWYDNKKDMNKKVWSSADGKTWYEHTVRNVNKTNTIWANGIQGIFTVFKNKLWLLGGWIQRSDKYNKDVWSFPHTIQE